MFYRVCFVSDFFYPRLGGVELHQLSLQQALKRRGHQIIVITGKYGKRCGIRTLTNGIKVYYCPVAPLVQQASLPSLNNLTLLIRQILIREEIQIVHAHASTSFLGLEALVHAKALGLRTVYTDHSLFGFDTAESILLNQIMKYSLNTINAAIAVSQCGKKNLSLRLGRSLDPRRIFVIPNAVDSPRFEPNPQAAPPMGHRLVIVLLSRLVYRKGIDLVCSVIPSVCFRFPFVEFLIGGDGPKRLRLEEMREKHGLQGRITLAGAVPHSKVRDFLCRGHIFLNASLTEAFCIAIIEAAACGLFVVATRVGGVPELIPEKFIKFAEPEASSLSQALFEVIEDFHSGRRSLAPWEIHREIAALYDWHQVAERTERVYEAAMAEEPPELLERLRELYGLGWVAGKIFCLLALFEAFVMEIAEILQPSENLDRAEKWPD